jgi:hypothetical protein
MRRGCGVEMTFEQYQGAFHPRIGRRCGGGGLESKQRGVPAKQSAAQQGLHESPDMFRVWSVPKTPFCRQSHFRTGTGVPLHDPQVSKARPGPLTFGSILDIIVPKEVSKEQAEPGHRLSRPHPRGLLRSEVCGLHHRAHPPTAGDEGQLFLPASRQDRTHCNKANPIESLSLARLRKLIVGDVRAWQSGSTGGLAVVEANSLPTIGHP